MWSNNPCCPPEQHRLCDRLFAFCTCLSENQIREIREIRRIREIWVAIIGRVERGAGEG